jgi:ribonuclease E
VPETSAPGFDSPPSLALEEEFVSSEADYSGTPSPGSAVSHEETTTEASPVAKAEKHGVEAQATSAASAEPTVACVATAEANAAAEAPASAPSAAEEPPRARRSGWWQRARASVIGK